MNSVPAKYRSPLLIALLVVASLLVTAVGAGRIEAQGPNQRPDRARNPVTPLVDHEFRFAEEVRGKAPGRQGGAGGSYAGYTIVMDEAETMSMLVPVEWNDIDLQPWYHGEHEIGMTLIATTDLAAFMNRDAPGILMAAFPLSEGTWTEEDLLAEQAENAGKSCAGQGRAGRFTFETPIHNGLYDAYLNCGGGKSQFIVATKASNQEVMILIRAVAFSPADVDAIARALETAQVFSATPGHDEHHEHEH